MSAERRAQPEDDDDVVQAIEISFAIPVYVKQLDYSLLNVLLDRIISRPANQLVDGCHWLAGQGCKPTWSQNDSRFLGITVDPGAPESGEPTFDDSVFFAESAARPYHDDDEKKKSAATQRKYLLARLAHQLKTLREYSDLIEAEMAKARMEKGGAA